MNHCSKEGGHAGSGVQDSGSIGVGVYRVSSGFIGFTAFMGFAVIQCRVYSLQGFQVQGLKGFTLRVYGV